MFLICGEALFDFFGDNTPGDNVAFDARIGGSPFNVAMGLARLGEEAGFFGGISRDALGERLVAKFRAEGVSERYILRTDYLTTLSLVQKDANGSPAYTFYGANAADRMVTEADLPDFDTPPAFLHVGSYTALVEPVAGALKTLIEREKTHTLISFDPNIRPTVVPDMGQWRQNTEVLVPLTDLIKVSDEDLELIAPGEPVAGIARKWLADGAGLVIVTRGGDGATAFMSGLEVDCPGIKVTVEDTVGAGDTFQAALLAGLKQLGVSDRKALESLRQDSLERLVEFAVKAAAITCSRRGADLPRRAELEKEWSALK
ncbi:carbohydrate kinase family protein [Roseibium sediminicola]|uniref:Carbohydrate kinase n=1 Tax=Roseibium sediminicola TaxID=2933272 RepID=A0ABT0GZK9_9HYPH|nr:carbohydrate kinase [Roseibium sp. CAU 1639]MCK7614640.1 carbohydrate kinase [Roseibium sp. CAU 1639]